MHTEQTRRIQLDGESDSLRPMRGGGGGRGLSSCDGESLDPFRAPLLHPSLRCLCRGGPLFDSGVGNVPEPFPSCGVRAPGRHEWRTEYRCTSDPARPVRRSAGSLRLAQEEPTPWVAWSWLHLGHPARSECPPWRLVVFRVGVVLEIRAGKRSNIEVSAAARTARIWFAPSQMCMRQRGCGKLLDRLGR